MAHTSNVIGFSAELTADRYTAPFDCREMKSFRFQVAGANTGTPAGVFKIQVSENYALVDDDVKRGRYGQPGTELAQWTTVTLPAGSVHGLVGAGQTFSGPDDEIAWSGADALNMWISLLDGGFMVRLWWDRTSGGTGNTPTVRAATRSR